jgi:carboxypeptidase C (cathepsin A)
MAKPSWVLFDFPDPDNYNKYVQDTTEEAAKDMAAFLFVFFEHFTKFKGRSFHMAGSSYGVRPFT